LFCSARKQFGGVRDFPAGELIGRVVFKNVGRLPAQKLRWLVRIASSGSNWRPPKIKSKDSAGESVVPVPLAAPTRR
jgi:hypothetical protein